MVTKKVADKTDGIYRTIIRFDAESDEYVVQLFVNGVHQFDADYFTDDKEDATNTAKSMRKVS